MHAFCIPKNSCAAMVQRQAGMIISACNQEHLTNPPTWLAALRSFRGPDAASQRNVSSRILPQGTEKERKGKSRCARQAVTFVGDTQYHKPCV